MGAYKAAPVEEKTQLPDITPMRRGRPTSSLGVEGHSSAKPSPSPRRAVGGDPFAALDANPSSTSAIEDEISSKFPSLDQFSLLHESGNNFNFDQPKPKPERQSQPSGVTEKARDISQRVTEALADEAFAALAPAKADIPTHSKSVPNALGRNHVATQTALSPPSPKITHPPRKSSMVSTGTMTSPSDQAPAGDSTPSSRPIFRFPPSDHHRSSSQPRPPASPRLSSSKGDTLAPTRPSLSEHRSKSQTITISKTPMSSRPSLETSRPLPADTDTMPQRARSAVTRSRPVSTHLETAAAFIKGRSTSRGKDSSPDAALISTDFTGASQKGDNISSNVEFLRAMEEEEQSKRKDKRMSSGSSKHSKRSSMPSMSLSGTKNLLAGRFGDAFKRFEHSGPGPDSSDDGFPESPAESSTLGLTPIAGSVATDGRSDDGQVLEETEDISPEMRRELERRRLSQEERRVAEAGAKYKQGLAAGPPRRDASKAANIQNKVQALLDESNKQSPTKTAEGYGRFTISPAPMSIQAERQYPPVPSPVPVLKKVPSAPAQRQDLPTRSPAIGNAPSPALTERSVPSRPSGPPRPQPKPPALRTGNTGGANPPIAAKPSNLTGNVGSANFRGGVKAAQQGLGISSAGSGQQMGPRLLQRGAGVVEQKGQRDGVEEDWEERFTKKYPSLAGLEMVETEISKGR